MKLLFLSLSFLITSINITTSDYSGTWIYAIETPEGMVKGEMVLQQKDALYTGTISVYGTDYEMTEVLVDGNSMSFKTNANGYSSVIKGTFSEDVYTAMISVEGIQIPMKAIKEK